jgi:hypothetical protein
MRVYGSEYTLEQLEANLAGFRETLTKLDNKETTPSRIIGTGYVNPRKQAYEYLNRQIGTYTILVDMAREQEGK